MKETGPESNLHQKLLEQDLKDLSVRPVLSASWWSTSALGIYLPTLKAWDEGVPRRIGTHMGSILENRAIRLYMEDKNFPRRTETQGLLTGWSRARNSITDRPIEAATVTEVAHVPVRSGRTLPMLRLMEHGNGNDQEYIVSLSDMAHYVQQDRVEITVS